MAKTDTPNYTAAQVALIQAAAPMNLDKARELADNPAMNDAEGQPRKARSIVAKAISLKVPYERKVAVRKDGTEVARKAQLVAEIAEAVAGNLEGLEKAPRAALVALRDALVA